MELRRNLDEAESLLLDARMNALPGGEEDELLAELYEMQGRLEKARLTYRPVVFPAGEIQRSNETDPVRLMRYAFLSRKTGHLEDEAVALGKIEGETRWDKMVCAANAAVHSNRELAVEYWTEALRLRPNDELSASQLALSRKLRDQERVRRIAEAKKALSMNPA
jgi:tetratricopeptide (TPR) repeat protein